MKKYISLDSVKDKINWCHGIEWSGATYLALDCTVKNGKHYPKFGMEVLKYAGKIEYCKPFRYGKNSVEYFGCMTGKWKPKKTFIEKVLKAYNKTEPS